jgi:integrase
VDVTALLNAADGLRCRDILVLIAVTEMPRGEALALRWNDIDLDAGLLTVRGTLGRIGGKLAVSEPKTDRSRRSALRWWRCCGRAASSKPPNGCTPGGSVDRLRTRVRHGVRDTGRTAQPGADHRDRRAQGRREGGRGAHQSGRGGVARAGGAIKAVANLLGHSSIAATGDLYGHTSDDAARAAVDGLIGTLGLRQLVE